MNTKHHRQTARKRMRLEDVASQPTLFTESCKTRLYVFSNHVEMTEGAIQAQSEILVALLQTHFVKDESQRVDVDTELCFEFFAEASGGKQLVARGLSLATFVLFDLVLNQKLDGCDAASSMTWTQLLHPKVLRCVSYLCSSDDAIQRYRCCVAAKLKNKHKSTTTYAFWLSLPWSELQTDAIATLLSLFKGPDMPPLCKYDCRPAHFKDRYSHKTILTIKPSTNVIPRDVKQLPNTLALLRIAELPCSEKHKQQILLRCFAQNCMYANFTMLSTEEEQHELGAIVKSIFIKNKQLTPVHVEEFLRTYGRGVLQSSWFSDSRVLVGSKLLALLKRALINTPLTLHQQHSDWDIAVGTSLDLDATVLDLCERLLVTQRCNVVYLHQRKREVLRTRVSVYSECGTYDIFTINSSPQQHVACYDTDTLQCFYNHPDGLQMSPLCALAMHQKRSSVVHKSYSSRMRASLLLHDNQHFKTTLQPLQRNMFMDVCHAKASLNMLTGVQVDGLEAECKAAAIESAAKHHPSLVPIGFWDLDPTRKRLRKLQTGLDGSWQVRSE